MEKDQIIILEDRGVIFVTGEDAKEYLQNIITNDIAKVDQNNTIHTALFSPQGKYLYEFFIIYADGGYLLDCDNEARESLISVLSKYILRSNVKLRDLSSSYVIGILNVKKFNEIQSENNKSINTIIYRESPFFIDPRKKELGARVLSSLEKLHLTIKKLNLKPKQWAYVECRIDDGSYEKDGQTIKKYDFILKNLALPPKEPENQESPF